MLDKPKLQFVWLKIVVSVCAAAAIGVKLLHPEIEVDAVVLGLFAVGVLPWLAPLVKSVELPGGLKLELQEIKDSVEQTRGTAESARTQAQLAVMQVVVAGAAPEQVATAVKSGGAPVKDFETKAAQLVAEYNSVRARQGYGSVRTQRMTEIVGAMIHLAQQDPGWDVAAALEHADRGWRLFAYACLYARPDFALFPRLAASAAKFTRDNRQFGTYWAIVSMQRVLSRSGGSAVAEAVRVQLEQLALQLEPGSDRDSEMRRVLATLKELPRS